MPETRAKTSTIGYRSPSAGRRAIDTLFLTCFVHLMGEARYSAQGFPGALNFFGDSFPNPGGANLRTGDPGRRK
jgi:hypothetical protein